MRLQRKVEHQQLGTVKVKELTVSELDSVLLDEQPDEADPSPAGTITRFDWLYDHEGMSLSLVMACTGLSRKDIEGSTPSQLEPVLNAVRKVNPVFFSRFLALKKMTENMIRKS